MISLLTPAVTGNRYSEKQHFYPRDVWERRNGTKVDRLKKIEKVLPFRKMNTLWLREWEKGRNVQKRKKRRRERQTIGQKVCLWCDSFLCRTRVSFCSNVCHQLGLVTRCECVCVCVCERSESALHTLKSWQKLNTVFPSSSAAIGVFVNLSLSHTHTHTHTQASPHTIFFPLYKRLVFSRTFSYYLFPLTLVGTINSNNV